MKNVVACTIHSIESGGVAQGHRVRDLRIFIDHSMNKLSISAGLVRPATARIIPFAAFIAFIVLQSVAGEWLRSMGLDTRWVYPARTIAVAFLLSVFWRHYIEIHDFAGITVPRMVIAITAGIAVFLLWIGLDFEWATFGKPTAFDPTLPDGSGLAWDLVFFRVIGLALVVPVMEELFWRSFLLRWIENQDFLTQDPARVGFRAMLLCAALFGSEHSLWLAGVVAGLVYNLTYMRGGNLWLPIVSHATTNGILAWWILATGHWQFW